VGLEVAEGLEVWEVWVVWDIVGLLKSGMGIESKPDTILILEAFLGHMDFQAIEAEMGSLEWMETVDIYK
jgi:hypothetical protein